MNVVRVALYSCLVILAASATAEPVKTDAEVREATKDERHLQDKAESLFFDDGDEVPNWKVEDLKKLKDDVAVSAFMSEYEKGLLPKTKVFIMRDPETREQTVKVAELLFAAEDFHQLYQVARLLKTLMNKEQFCYCLASVLLNRPDINVRLPPWYLVFPNYFFRDAVLSQFKKAKEEGKSELTLEVDPLVNPEDNKFVPKYVTEDIALSSLYFNSLLHWPSWFDYTRHGQTTYPRRGQAIGYIHNQFGQRIYLEGSLKSMTNMMKAWDDTMVTDRDLDLRNSVGEKMSNDAIFTKEEYNTKEYFMPFESVMTKTYNLTRYTNFVTKDSKVLKLEETRGWSLSKLGDLLYNTTDSPNPDYYKSPLDDFITFFSGEFRSQTEPKRTAMSYTMSAFRHNGYFNILLMFDEAVRNFATAYYKPYDPEEWGYPGVTLNALETDRLETYFEVKEVDMSRSLGGGKFTVKTKRLNHSPFNVHLNVTNSNPGEEEAVVRLFLMPIAVESPEIYMKVQIDRFIVKLQPGENLIERRSQDFASFVEDKDIDPETYKDNVSKNKVQCGLPDNMMLPKGTADGLQFVLSAIVYKFKEADFSSKETKRHFDNYVVCGSPDVEDFRDFAFPWDRDHYDYDISVLPNVVVKNVTVYHKDS